MSKINKIINLIKKTGDKAVILDKNGDPEYVIMSFNQYEKLIYSSKFSEELEQVEGHAPHLGAKRISEGLTEDVFLDKINRDVEKSKNEKNSLDFPFSDPEPDFSPKAEEISSFGQKYFNKEKNQSSLGENDQPRTDESDSRVEAGENEEDQYYFEPVE